MGNKIGAKKLTITITKDGLTQIGTTTQIGEIIGVSAQTIRNWHKAGDTVKGVSGYVVHLNCVKLETV